jgi:hypothetical protein
LAIHEICADSGELVREPDEFLVAFKKCLDDAANDARVAGPERSTLLARLVIVFMQELYGMERRETVREDSACRGKSLPGVGHYQH